MVDTEKRRERAARIREKMEETMFKLLVAICLTGAAGLLLIGGCTPESENTWSEDVSFADVDIRFDDMTSTYTVSTNIDDRFTSLTLFQTGGTLQGSDNMRRSWRGTIEGTLPSGAAGGSMPRLQIQTSDGPEGQVIIVGNGQIFIDMFGHCYRGINGQLYSGDKSGSIQLWGPPILCTPLPS